MVTFAYATEVALQEMAEELSPTAMPSYRSHAKKALAYWKPERELQTVTRSEVQAWVNARKREVSSATVRHELSFFSRLWRVLEETGVDLPCPLYRVRKPKLNNNRERVINQAELDALRGYLRPEQFDAVEFARLTFLRRMEQWRLRPTDIRLWLHEGQLVGKARIVTSKTGKGRIIPLSPPAAAIAQRLVEACEATSRKYLFGPDRSDRQAAARRWSRRFWNTALKALKIRNAHWHDLRHLGATTAWRNGAKLEQIRFMLGHSSVKMTERYLHIEQEEMWGAAIAAGQAIPTVSNFAQYNQSFDQAGL